MEGKRQFRTILSSLSKILAAAVLIAAVMFMLPVDTRESPTITYNGMLYFQLSNPLFSKTVPSANVGKKNLGEQRGVITEENVRASYDALHPDELPYRLIGGRIYRYKGIDCDAVLIVEDGDDYVCFKVVQPCGVDMKSVMSYFGCASASDISYIEVIRAAPTKNRNNYKRKTIEKIKDEKAISEAYDFLYSLESPIYWRVRDSLAVLHYEYKIYEKQPVYRGQRPRAHGDIKGLFRGLEKST